MAHMSKTHPSTTLLGRAFFNLFILILSGAVVAVQVFETLGDVSPLNVATLAVLGMLFALVQVQVVFVRVSGGRSIRRMLSRLQGAAYISDMARLPNRNFMLAELRREMPRARKQQEELAILIMSLQALDGVRERRGDDFAERAVRALAVEVRQRARGSDFAAYLGDGAVGVLLFDCGMDGIEVFLGRMANHIAISDGRRMMEIPIEVRFAGYDMESIYATDVLRAAEESEVYILSDPDTHWSSLA
jgi:diguanylate cyclase (GGDEF)-like protein